MAARYHATMHAAVFLDRDNTLIKNNGDLGEPDAVELIDGVPEGLCALNDAGYSLVVVSNQGGVARGVFSEQDVDAVHQRIAELIDETAATGEDIISRFYYCPYHPEGVIAEYRREHAWRKPSPGMLLQAASDMGLDLARSWMVGDQPRDVDAGRAAGCRTILLSADANRAADTDPTATAPTFAEAVATILKSGPPDTRGATEAANATRDALRHRGSGNPAGGGPDKTLDDLRRAVNDLTDHLRSEGQRRSEFTGLRLAAGMCQLLAVLLAVLGLLQLDAAASSTFMKWMAGAVLVQLVTIAVLLLDLKT